MKNSGRLKKVITFIVCCLTGLGLGISQSIYVDFGQNRIQHRAFKWNFIQGSSNVRVLYYGKNQNLAKNIQQIASEELPRIEQLLSYKSGSTIQLLAFASMNDFRQSNFGYINPQWNTGGFTLFPKDAGSLAFNGDYSGLRIQIRKNICDIVLREMIYGGTLQDRFDRMRSPALPVWFTSGLSEFISNPWSAENESAMREATSKGSLNNFNLLTSEGQTFAGKSIWRYLAEIYGPESIPAILFIARYTNSAEIGIQFHTKKLMSDFISDWKNFYLQQLKSEELSSYPRGAVSIPVKISGKHITSMALNPDGTKVAIVTNDHGRFELWIHELKNSASKKIYSGGQKVLNQVTDYQFPKVKWEKSGLNLLYYNKGNYRIRTIMGEGRQNMDIIFNEFESVSDFELNANGDSLYLSAVQNNQSDIFLGTKQGNEWRFRPVTNDADYENALMLEGSALWFVKNTAELKSEFYSFPRIYLLTGGKEKYEGTLYGASDVSELILYNDTVIGFLMDKTGMTNAWILNTQSKRISGQTNYKRNVISQQVSSNQKTLIELLKIQGRNTIYSSTLSENPLLESVEIPVLPWKSVWSNPDSLLLNRKSNNKFKYPGIADSAVISKVDTFGRQQYRYQTGFNRVDYEETNVNRNSQRSKSQTVSTRDFNPLIPDYVITQSDNTQYLPDYFLNNTPFKVLRNPVIMPMIKFSGSDLLKNNTVEAMARTNLDLTYTDYSFRYSYLKQKADYEFYLHRRSRKYDDISNTFRQNISVNAELVRSLAIDEKLRLCGGFGLRNEISLLKASEKSTFGKPDYKGNFIYFDADLVYDNTISQGMNSPVGSRGRIGISKISGLNQSAQLTIFHSDLRFYLPIYKGIILAIRNNAVYQPGRDKIAYYAGGVENWTVREQMSADVLRLTGDRYVFMQWVSGIRGFYRGARVGSNFMTFNAEIRVPVIKMIRRLPMNNEFMRNLTFNAFSDAATAFTGKTPADVSNPFNTIFINSPNYRMSVTSRRNPWIYSFGGGVRTRILGYFLKYDYAWGFSDSRRLSPLGQLSLGLDF